MPCGSWRSKQNILSQKTDKTKEEDNKAGEVAAKLVEMLYPGSELVLIKVGAVGLIGLVRKK